MNLDAIQLQAALISERTKTYINSGSCSALGGECRFLYPYNQRLSHPDKYGNSPIPNEKCDTFNCPFWERG
jgi:hypothetical protein